MAPDTLRIHHFEPASRANGPGLRAVLWLQGCTLGCSGCFNPETHGLAGGDPRSVVELSELICSSPGVEGLTISGGEPLQQLKPLGSLLQRVKKQARLSIILFTGFEWEEVDALPGSESILKQVDVLLTGRYFPNTNITGFPNGCKKIHLLSGRYSLDDLKQAAQAEVLIDARGEVRLSGVIPLAW